MTARSQGQWWNDIDRYGWSKEAKKLSHSLECLSKELKKMTKPKELSELLGSTSDTENKLKIGSGRPFGQKLPDPRECEGTAASRSLGYDKPHVVSITFPNAADATNAAEIFEILHNLFDSKGLKMTELTCFQKKEE